MNYKMISYSIGRILLVEAILLVLPAIVSIIYGDGVLSSFAITIAALAVTGILATRKKPQNKSIYAKDGYVIVAFTWILMSLFGALPFTLSGHIPSYVDAFLKRFRDLQQRAQPFLKTLKPYRKACFSGAVLHIG